MTNIKNKTPEELQALIAEATEQLQTLQQNKYKEVVAQIKELAHSIGVTVEIHDGNKKLNKAAGTTVPDKYRNPNDHAQTWKGRGMMPAWLKAFVAEGHDKDEYLIN